jgi:superfamily II DNA/RNA helicase
LCSATFPRSVQRIAADFLKLEFYFASIGRVGTIHAHIRRHFEWVNNPAEKKNAVVQRVREFLPKYYYQKEY